MGRRDADGSGSMRIGKRRQILRWLDRGNGRQARQARKAETGVGRRVEAGRLASEAKDRVRLAWGVEGLARGMGGGRPAAAAAALLAVVVAAVLATIGVVGGAVGCGLSPAAHRRHRRRPRLRHRCRRHRWGPARQLRPLRRLLKRQRLSTVAVRDPNKRGGRGCGGKPSDLCCQDSAG